MLKRVNGKWALVSRKTQRPLAYYDGEGKPSEEWVKKQESRIQYFKHTTEDVQKDILDKSGAGQWGTPELTKQYMKDTPGQAVKTFKKWLTNAK